MSRTQVELSDESYLDAVGRFERSRYIRLCIDERLARVREAFAGLRSARGESEVEDLVAAADMPWARAGSETDLPTLTEAEREAVSLLWEEAEATRMTPGELIAALAGGRPA